MKEKAKTTLTCLVIAASLLSFPSMAAQNQHPTAAEQVLTLVNRILARGEGNVNGIKTTTWVPPQKDELAIISTLGNEAIAPLNSELDSPVPFRQLLAVRLLEQVGGPGIIPPLKRGLQENRWVVVRMQSLSSLRSAPDALAIPILKNALADKDDRVAQRAKDLLTVQYKIK